MWFLKNRTHTVQIMAGNYFQFASAFLLHCLYSPHPRQVVREVIWEQRGTKLTIELMLKNGDVMRNAGLTNLISFDIFLQN